MGALGVREVLEAEDSQVDEVGLDSREEELGVLPAHTGEETVLEERGGHELELGLETEERLLPAQARTRELSTGAEGCNSVSDAASELVVSRRTT